MRKLGITLIPATAPDFFLEDAPTAVLVPQVLRAIAQFDKATVVAKLKAARDRKREEEGECGGRKSYAERNPEMVNLTRTAPIRGAGRCRCARFRLASIAASRRQAASPIARRQSPQ